MGRAVVALLVLLGSQAPRAWAAIARVEAVPAGIDVQSAPAAPAPMTAVPAYSPALLAAPALAVSLPVFAAAPALVPAAPAAPVASVSVPVPVPALAVAVPIKAAAPAGALDSARAALAPETAAGKESSVARLFEGSAERSGVPAVGPEDAAELKLWGNRRRTSFGPLLNPPAGRASAETRRAEALVKGIVEKLGGERLRAAGRQVVVTLYPDETPNAFMGPLRWPPRGENAPKNPVVLKLYGLDAGKPVYELGVTRGLLGLMRTEDELAFVIAHELQHLLDGHVDSDEHSGPGASAKGWWSSQRHEAVADHLALGMMLGKYDLEAGLTALGRLFPDGPAAPDKDQLNDFLASHHHEGVRLALAQAYVEHLRRTDPAAQPRMQTPPPGGSGAPRPGRKSDAASRPELIAAFDKILKESILARVPLAHARASRVGSAASDEDVVFLLDRGLERIAALRAPPQRTGDAVLSLLQRLVVTFDLEGARSAAVFAAPVRLRLQKVLLAAAKSPRGWKARAFHRWQDKGLESDTGSFHKSLEFVSPPELQAVFAGLARINPEWAGFAATLVREGSVDGQGRFAMDTSMIGEAFRLKGPLGDELSRQALDYVSSGGFRAQLTEGLRARDRRSYGVMKQLGQLVHPGLREALGPLAAELSAERVLLVSQLADGRADAASVSALFQALDLSEDFPWAVEDEPRLALALAASARFRLRGEFSDPALGVDPNLNAALHRAAASPALSKDQRLDVLKFIAAMSRFYGSYSAEDAPLIADLRAAFGRLTPAEIVTLTTGRVPSIDRRVEELLGDGTLAAAVRESKEFHANGFKNTPKGPARKAAFKRYLEGMRERDSRLRGPLRELGGLLNRRAGASLSPLSMLGADRALSAEAASKVPLGELKRLLVHVRGSWDELEADFARVQDKPWIPDSEGFQIGAGAGLFLLDAFRARQGEIGDVEEWLGMLKELSAFNAVSLDMRPETKGELEARFLALTAGLAPERRYELARREEAARVLSLDTLTRLASDEAARRMAAAGPEGAAEAIRQVERELSMKEKRPDLLHAFREELAEKVNAQPAQLDAYFPEDAARFDSKTTEGFSLEIRGMSAFAALARPQPVREQLRMIEYLMGREPDPPAFVERAARSGDRYVPLSDLLRNARLRLSREGPLARMFVADVFLAGPSSVLERGADRAAVIDHLLKPVAPENRALAGEMAEALLRSQGPMKSLAAAYVLAQKPEEGRAALSEGEIIRSLFEAFGAAGIKLGQYLAFTAEFERYRPELARLQDAALPLSYLQAARLVQKRLGGTWPDSWRVVGVLGSGSVNVAVEYHDDGLKVTRVVSLLRSDIQAAAREDFRKLQAFTSELAKLDAGRPAAEQRFSHLPGLLTIIERSVTLEFDKERTRQVQNRADEFYRRSRDGWTLRSVRADWARGGGLSMEKAAGRSARKVRGENPALYRRAMSLVLGAELDLLFGAGADGRPSPVPLFANPDMHDGQVLIDEKSKTATVLDFGQALEISNAERALGVKVLRLISGRESRRGARALVDSLAGRGLVSDAELERIVSRPDSMDRFVRLLSTLEGRGVRLPLPAVHWVLGVNRAMQLGRNVGLSTDAQFYGLILADRAGIGSNGFLALRRWAGRLGLR